MILGCQGGPPKRLLNGRGATLAQGVLGVGMGDLSCKDVASILHRLGIVRISWFYQQTSGFYQQTSDLTSKNQDLASKDMQRSGFNQKNKCLLCKTLGWNHKSEEFSVSRPHARSIHYRYPTCGFMTPAGSIPPLVKSVANGALLFLYIMRRKKTIGI